MYNANKQCEHKETFLFGRYYAFPLIYKLKPDKHHVTFVLIKKVYTILSCMTILKSPCKII